MQGFSLKEAYSLLECQYVDKFNISIKNPKRNYKDCCYIDDEGLFITSNHIFTFDGNIYYGSGLVVGTDDEGGTISPEISFDEVQGRVKFPEFIHQEWVQTFLDEKNIDINMELNNGHTIRSTIDHFSFAGEDAANKIKSTLVEIDYRNGDPIHFFNYLSAKLQVQ